MVKFKAWGFFSAYPTISTGKQGFCYAEFLLDGIAIFLLFTFVFLVPILMPFLVFFHGFIEKF